MEHLIESLTKPDELVQEITDGFAEDGEDIPEGKSLLSEPVHAMLFVR